jgi:hypothetical protein
MKKISELRRKMMKRYVCIGLMVVLAALSLNAGVVWKTRMTVDSNNKNQRNEVMSITSAQNGDVRQQFEEVKKKDALYSDQVYWLYKNKDQMMYIINDKEKTIMPMSIDGMLQMAGALGELVKIQISDQVSNAEDMGMETVLGRPCKHVRINREYTMTMKIAIIKKTFMVKEVRDIWGSRDVEGVSEIGAAYLGKEFRTGHADLDALIEKESKLMAEVGFPLKTISKQTQMNKKGKIQGETTSTTEVISIEKKSIDASLFELPQGYEKVSLIPEEAEEGKGEKKKKFGLF